MVDILKEARKRFEFSSTAWAENREAAEDDLLFLNGEQWPSTVRRQREEDGRPCLTINKLPGFIDQVIGDIRQNKMAIKIIPVDDQGDPQIAEIYEGITRSIQSQSNAEDIYDWACECMVMCGFGYWRVVTEYADNTVFDQRVRIRRILNPFSVYFDPAAQEESQADAKYCFVTEWVSREDFSSQWPKATPVEMDDSGLGDDISNWVQEDSVRVAEYWWKEPYKRRMVMMSNGVVLDGEEVDKIGDELAMAGIYPEKERTVDSHKLMWAKVDGLNVLEGPEEWPGQIIPIVPVLGKEIFVKGQRHLRGLIRFAKDAQRMYNYWRSAATEFVAMIPKAPYLMTPEQVEGHEAQWAQAHQKTYPYLLYNPDPQAPGAPQRQGPPTQPTGILQESAISSDELKATTGIYDASLGSRSNETSGRAILARQREGDTATFAYPDNLRKAIQHTGKILIELIPKIYDTAQQIRIRGEDDSESMVQINQEIVDVQTGETVLVNDLSTGRYDVQVQVGPSFNTKRIEAVNSMIQFIQAFPGAAPIIGDLLAKNMDWPGAEEIADRLKLLLPPQLQQQTGQPSPMAGPMGGPPTPTAQGSSGVGPTPELPIDNPMQMPPAGMMG